MAIRINPILNNDALDHALVECLRLFAQHGRRIRVQKLSPDEKLSDNTMLKQKSNISESKTTN